MSPKSCILDNGDYTIKNGRLIVLRLPEETTLRHTWESHVDEGRGANALRHAYLPAELSVPVGASHD